MDIQLAMGLAVIATIVLVVLAYVLVIPQSKNGNLSAFGQFLHNLFNFKKLYLEAVLKFFYVAGTILCVCTGFFLLFARTQVFYYSHSTAGEGFAILILGPIFIRLVYEAAMLKIIEVKNVIEINNKVNSKNTDAFANENSFTERFAKVATTTASAVSKNVQSQINQAKEQAAQAKEQAAQQAAQAKEQETEQNATITLQKTEEAGTKICPNCGKQLSANAKFCNACGTKLDEVK